MEPDEGFTLISTGPESHTSALSPSSRNINEAEREVETENTRPSVPPTPRMPVAIARIGNRIKRPVLLILVAILDLVVNHIFFFFILDELNNSVPIKSTNEVAWLCTNATQSSSGPATSNPGHTSVLLPLLIFGYLRPTLVLLLSLRKNWSARGKLWTTVLFVVTGLGVLWEINLSVLYRGWGGDEAGLRDRNAKWKMVYLVMVSGRPAAQIYKCWTDKTLRGFGNSKWDSHHSNTYVRLPSMPSWPVY